MENQVAQLSFVTALQHGGFTTALIALAMAISIAFIIERVIRLFLQMNINGRSFMAEIQTYLLNNDLDGAIRVCNGARNAALPKVIKAGLMRASRSEEQIQNALDAASLEVIPQLERNLPYLALIANVATLLGLLGTISGLIRSFAAIANADPAQRQALLSAGISEAMFATAFGLVVAIATMIFHSVLSSKASRIVSEIDEHSVKLLDLLLARKVQHSSEK
ncbi:MotA/TolQ/ExbB proton channel family protein [bacterium]|jgi:biopolymer transport protein ExbB|nr:MotA/TolQ/ExbB proton channel family protein [bacterium]